MSDPKRRAQIGAAARKRAVEEFSSTAITTRMADLYEQVIEDARR